MARPSGRQRERTLDPLETLGVTGLLLLFCVFHPAVSSCWAQDDAALCSYTSSELGPLTAKANAYNLRSIFVTFPNAVESSGDSLLPGYADEMTHEFTEFLSWASRGRHMVDFQVVKRQGADSTYAWVMSRPSSQYFGVEQLMDELRPMLPRNWDDGLDLPILFFAARSPCCGPLGLSHQGLGSEGNYIAIRYGSPSEHGYIMQDPWLIKGVLVHEYGHQLGADHLPDGTSGSIGWCFGGYWSCYGAMDRRIFTGCDRWREFNGYVPYHVYNLIRFRWILPRVLRGSEKGVVLRDVRRTGEVLKIPVPGTQDQEYFLVVNHQMNDYDAILNGRGLLIWHIREEPGGFHCSTRSTTQMTIIDLEHQSGLWRIEYGNDEAPLWPHQDDIFAGRDTLDYSPGMLPSAFYSGLSLGGSPLRASSGFGTETSPSSLRYRRTAVSRRDPQVTPSGIELRCVEALPDPDVPGSYVMKLDIAVY